MTNLQKIVPERLRSLDRNHAGILHNPIPARYRRRKDQEIFPRAIAERSEQSLSSRKGSQTIMGEEPVVRKICVNIPEPVCNHEFSGFFVQQSSFTCSRSITRLSTICRPMNLLSPLFYYCIVTKYSIFIRASSETKALFVFVTFRSCLLKFSILFVV